MYIKLFQNIGAGKLVTNRQFFLSVYSNTYPLSNSYCNQTTLRFRIIGGAGIVGWVGNFSIY